MSKEKTNIVFLIVVIVLVSALILSFQLETRSLWADELFSLKAGEKLLTSNEEFFIFVNADVHPPLYFFLLGQWMRITGTGDAAIRFFSVISAVFMLIFSYFLSRKMFSERNAFYSVALVSISPFFILYSRMARYYSFEAMLFCLSCFFFLKTTGKENKFISSILYIIFSSCMVLTFYPSVFAVAGQNIFYFLFSENRKKTRKNWILNQVLLVVITVPFCLALFEQYEKFSKDSAADFSSSLKGIVASVADLFYEFSAGGTIFPWEGAGIILLLMNFFLFILGIKRMRNTFSQAFLFLISIMSVTVSGMIMVFNIVATEHSFIFFASRCFFLFPFFIFIISFGIESSKKFGIIALFLILFMNFFPLNNYFSGKSFLNPVYAVPSREIAQNILENYGEKDNFVIAPFDTIVPEYLYRVSGQSRISLYRDREKAISDIFSQKPRFVTLVYFGRDRTKIFFSDDPAENIMSIGYSFYDEKKYTKIDARYLKLKEYLLKRPCYSYKLIVKTFKKIEK